MNTKEYVPPTVTVDAVVFKLIENELNVLLIERHKEPFKGQYALPGGYNAQGETTLEATTRIASVKAGVDIDSLNHVEQLYTFDAVARDPRGHAVAVVYMGLGVNVNIEKDAETENPQFFPVKSLPELAYDHKDIIHMAHKRLKSKISYTNIVFALLQKNFTYTELQKSYEAIFGYELDKRNFRKKFASLDLVEETGKMSEGQAHRPAKLYRFKKNFLEELTRTFE